MQETPQIPSSTSHVPVLLIDIVGFSRRTPDWQDQIMDDLQTALDDAAHIFDQPRDPWPDYMRTPTGDGYYLFFLGDRGTPTKALEFAQELHRELTRRNTGSSALDLRLRMTLVVGSIQKRKDQYRGDCLTEANRINDSRALRIYAEESSSATVLSLSDLFRHKLGSSTTEPWQKAKEVDKHGGEHRVVILADDAEAFGRTLTRLSEDTPSQKPEKPEENVASADLNVWLKRVKADHATLLGDFQTQAGFDLLDPVYVDLNLTADLHSAMLRGKASHNLEKLDHTPKSLREYLDLAPDAHDWVTRRWVVKGDPGAGKTTLLRHLASKLAEEALAGGDGLIPVFESLPRLARSGKWLLDKIDERMKLLGDGKGFGSMLDGLGKAGRLLLLFDGLDEVPRELRGDAEALLCRVAERWPKSQLVVSSRPIGFRSPGSVFLELEIQPLTQVLQRKFLACWFGRFEDEPKPDWTRADDCLPHLASAPSLRDLAGNPLYLTLMALLFENGEEPGTIRTKLYGQIFDLLLKSGHRPKDEREEMPRIPATQAALRELAEELTRDNRDAASREELADRLYDLPCRKKLCGVDRWSERLSVFLDDLSERTSILGPHDGEDADWRFWHRTFREALTAEALAQLGDPELIDRVKEIEGDESRWAEAFALLVGHRGEQADALVRTLLAENQALGLRALATAQGLSEEVIDEAIGVSGDLLEGGWEDRHNAWKKRHEIYERLPELVGDADRTLHLIDRLRRRENLVGGELFLLDHAAGRVGEIWENEAERAGRLRSKLYKHLQAPPKNLFETVETPLDGVVDLWREIPAGEFLMGSPDGEGDSDEHPRHLVKIMSPFLMSATVVTNRQYAAFDPKRADMDKPNHPVVSVNWYEAMAFCAWLSRSYPGVRLPTEEEWEYACRAGTSTKYWSGDSEEDLARVGWYGKNSGHHVHPVGEKPANLHGLYDMHGNIREWMLSEWDSQKYSKRPKGYTFAPKAADLAGLDPGVRRVFRGGSFEDSAVGARSAYRINRNPRTVYWFLGFRLLLPSVPELGN